MKLETLLYASLLLLGSAAPLAAQAYRVGTPFQPRRTIGRIDGMVASPDGLWTVYVGDQRQWGVREIYSVRSDGSRPARLLNDPFAAGGDVQLGTGEELGLHVTADGMRVVYRADAAVDEQFELFSARIDGHGHPLRLNPALGPGETVKETLLLVPGEAGGAERVVFGVGPGSWPRALYLAPVDGSAPARRIDAGAGYDLYEFAISPDATRFLYVAGSLFAGPLDGSSAPVEIATTATLARFSPDGARIVFRQFSYPPSAFWLASVPSTGGATTLLAYWPFDFEISANSGHVVFRSGGETNARISCVPIAGGTVQILSSYPGNGHVIDYAVTPGGHVVFRGTQPEGQGLYSVSFPGGTAQRISHELAPSTAVYDFRLSPDGDTALYRAGTSTARTLHSVAVDGYAAALALADEVEDDYRFTPDGSCATYRAGASPSLYRRALDGSTAPLRLDDSEPPVPTLSFALDPSGQRVLYRRETESIDLLSVRGDGTETRRLNLPLPTVSLGGVGRFQATGDGERCVYLADAELEDVVELWSSPTRRGSASVRLNCALQPSGDVQSDFVLTSDDCRVVFRADGDEDGRFDLFVSPLSGLEPPVALTSAFAADQNVANGLLIDPSGQHAVFRAAAGSSGVNDLFIAPLSGASPPVPRNDNADSGVAAGVRFAGECLLYLGRRSGSGRFDLYRVPFDGSAAPLRLNDPPAMGGGIAAGASSFLATPDGERAIYLSAQTDFTRFDLYSVPVDRSSAPVRLNGPLGSGTSITSFQLSADGTYVLYETAASGPSDYRLHGVPVDRSLAPVELVSNPTQPTSSIPVGSVAVVRREDGLAVVPVDGSAPALALTPSLSNLREFVVSPDGEFVVYARGYPSSGISELDRVPTAGGSPPEPVLGPLPAYHQVFGDFRITPDGRRIVYKGVLGPRVGLFSKRLADDGTGTWLADEVHMLADPTSFVLTADSRRVLFQRGTSFQTYELYASELAQRQRTEATGPR